MKEAINILLCPKCGTPMEKVPSGRYQKANFHVGGRSEIYEHRCPLEPKDYRIKELERELGAREAQRKEVKP